MRVRCLYFASLQSAVGEAEQEFELPAGSRVGDLLQLVEDRYPEVARYGRRYKVAVNCEFVEPEAELPEGAEVALLPPVSGGSGDAVFLSEEPLSIDEALAAVRRPDCGAVALFVGTVRDSHEGQPVTHLDYSAYQAMALPAMQRLADEARARWQLGGLVLGHRTGRVEAGEPAVVVAVSSGHRRESFEASRWLIDSLKAQVPIWKKEVGPGGAVWIEGDARVSG